MKRYCLALDLHDEEELIEEYIHHHQHVWPEIRDSIKASGILEMEIYRYRDRLFMIMETRDDFSFDRKANLDKGNPVVKEWEDLMWKYQRSLDPDRPEEKWQLMDKIFEL